MIDMDETVRYRRLDSHPGYWAGDDGTIWSQYIKRFLRPSCDSNGYACVSLQEGKIHKKYRVHRLVLMAFCGPCPENCEGCHANDIKIDNRFENLRWGTSRDNKRDALKKGLWNAAKGEAQGSSKLTADQVREIRASGLTQTALAGKYGVRQTQISRIKNGLRWKHVS